MRAWSIRANDAQAVSAELEKLGFRVNLLVDKNREEMSEAISLFVDRLNSTEINADTGLIFYAGHGVQIDGENYLLPTNVQARNVVSLVDSSLSLDNLIRQLERTKKAGLIFLDCCRNNPFPAATRALGGGLAKIDAPAGIFIAFSTAPGAVALDGEDTANSPFTSSLISHLPSVGISVSQMMIRVRRDVFDKSSGRQMPWDSSSLLVDFAFNPTALERTVQSEPLSPEAVDKRRREGAARTEADAWELTSQSNSEQLLRSFVTTYPYSRHRGAAVQRLRRLQTMRSVYRASKVAAALVVAVFLLAIMQWTRLLTTKMEKTDLVGGDIGVILSEVKFNPFDKTHWWCQMRCVFGFWWCKAYSYDHELNQCFIKEDVLFLQRLATRTTKSRRPICGGTRRRWQTPFKILWDLMFESGDTLLPNGDPAPPAVFDEGSEFNAHYNAWGQDVSEVDKERTRNPGIACQLHCLNLKNCVGFTFNTLNRRCKLFRWIRQDDQRNPRLIAIPHYTQPDENSRMTLYVPMVISGIHPERNK